MGWEEGEKEGGEGERVREGGWERGKEGEREGERQENRDG